MTFDINTVSAPNDNTQRVGIAFDDDGTATAGFIVASENSTTGIAAAQKARIDTYKRQATKPQRIDAKTDEGATALDKIVYAAETEKLLALTVDWFGFTSGGQPAAFDPGLLREFFAARPTWRERVKYAIENEAAFLPQSPTT